MHWSVTTTYTLLSCLQVNHSMKMNQKPLTPWVVAEENGKIVAAHCDCMAGLGESCTHVASLLWAIESGVRIRDSMTVTEKKAYWVIPSAVKEAPYAPVRLINFEGRKGSLAKLASPQCQARKSSDSAKATTPSTADKAKFMQSLASCPSKPAILALIEPHSGDYIPKSADEALPVCLTNLYQPEYLKLNYSELLKESAQMNIAVSPEQARLVESKTRDQASSRLWFRMRAGRITASRFKSACCTDVASPSLSLIMAICHPETTKFRNIATTGGCEHEKNARIQYQEITVSRHENCDVTKCGFFINPEYPFVGASPDGLVTCSCCSEGIYEIKVYTHAHTSIHDILQCTVYIAFLLLNCLHN